MVARKGGLGKGLEALFVDNTTDEMTPSTIKISEIEPNKSQPRKDFDENALAELADSIREHGVLQPLLVRPLSNGRYQIVAGERRWRASRMAGLTELPVVIKELSDSQTMEIALIENLQRQDLNAIEEALGYKTLMEEFSLTQEVIAQRVGKSRPAVANALRLLNLPTEISEFVRNGELSTGHARTLLSVEDKVKQLELAQQAAKSGMSVRELEKLTSKKKSPNGGKLNKDLEPTEQNKKTWGDNFYKEFELAMAAELSRKIKIDVNKNKGSITIDFYSKSELMDIAERLTQRKIKFNN